MMHQAADASLRDISSEVTVQIEPKANTDTEKLVSDVTGFPKAATRPADGARVERGDSAALLEPWLGKSDVLKTLPVPRLIALEMDLASPANMDALRGALTGQFKEPSPWTTTASGSNRSGPSPAPFALGGLAILLLVGAATTAIIVSATRSAMASNRDVVEVLHFVGATDRFIARNSRSTPYASASGRDWSARCRQWSSSS